MVPVLSNESHSKADGDEKGPLFPEVLVSPVQMPKAAEPNSCNAPFSSKWGKCLEQRGGNMRATRNIWNYYNLPVWMEVSAGGWLQGRSMLVPVAIGLAMPEMNRTERAETKAYSKSESQGWHTTSCFWHPAFSSIALSLLLLATSVLLVGLCTFNSIFF